MSRAKTGERAPGAPDEHVPGKEHYSWRYVRGGRIFSYAHQIDSAMRYEPNSVLEVGPGPGLVTAALRALGVEVSTADVQPELQPDIVASVLDLPIGDASFDVSICGQVLEHLPSEQFQPALRVLRRVTRRALILSLPDASRCGSLAGRLPKIGSFCWQWEYPFFKRGAFPQSKLERMGHYWEIGHPPTRLPFVRRSIESAGWRLVRTWRAPELLWHRFFICEPAESDHGARDG